MDLLALPDIPFTRILRFLDVVTLEKLARTNSRMLNSINMKRRLLVVPTIENVEFRREVAGDVTNPQNGGYFLFISKIERNEKPIHLPIEKTDSDERNAIRWMLQKLKHTQINTLDMVNIPLRAAEMAEMEILAREFNIHVNQLVLQIPSQLTGESIPEFKRLLSSLKSSKLDIRFIDPLQIRLLITEEFIDYIPRLTSFNVSFFRQRGVTVPAEVVGRWDNRSSFLPQLPSSFYKFPANCSSHFNFIVSLESLGRAVRAWHRHELDFFQWGFNLKKSETRSNREVLAKAIGLPLHKSDDYDALSYLRSDGLLCRVWSPVTPNFGDDDTLEYVMVTNEPDHSQH